MSGDGWGAAGHNRPAKGGRAASGTPLDIAFSWDSPIPIMTNEKEKIERATADAFINLYNRQLGSSFRIVKYSDAPDSKMY